MIHNNFAKIAIIGSVLAHIIVFIIIITATKNDEIATRFIVLGAHSKNLLHATYKSMPLPGSQKTGAGASGTKIKSTPSKPVKKVIKKPKPQKRKRTIPKKEKIPLKKMPTSIVEEKKTMKTPNKLRRKESDDIDEPRKKKDSTKKNKKEEIKEGKKNTPPPTKTKEAQELDDESPQSTEDSNLTAGNTNEIESIGINLSDLSKELTIYQECVQKEVLRLWSPPVGVPKGTECTLHFVISDTGKVSHVDFIKRSQMMLYDLSIQQVAYRFDFDKRLWGKQFTIDFRQ